MPKNSPLFVEIGPGLSFVVGLPTIATWKTAERPKKAKRGTFGFNTETKNLEYCNGTDWYRAAMGHG